MKRSSSSFDDRSPKRPKLSIIKQSEKITSLKQELDQLQKQIDEVKGKLIIEANTLAKLVQEGVDDGVDMVIDSAPIQETKTSTTPTIIKTSTPQKVTKTNNTSQVTPKSNNTTQIISPKNTTSTTTTSPTPNTKQSPKPIKSEYNDKILFRNRTTEASYNIKSSFYQAHDAKPRSIVYNPNTGKHVATSGFDGCIRFWEISPDEERLTDLGSLSASALRTTRYPTALYWHKDGGKCAALMCLPKDSNLKYITDNKEPQLVILNTTNLPRVTATFFNEKPHTQDPSAGVFYTEEKYISVGADKKVVLWNINYNTSQASIQELHNGHTSAITGIEIVQDNIVTVGKDKKIINYSLDKMAVVSTFKDDNFGNWVVKNPKHNHILLVSKFHNKSPIGIFDLRTNKYEFSLEYKDIVSNPSQYIIPSWNSEGMLVAQGTTENLLNLWDLRYNKVSLPSFHTAMHKKRVLRAEFSPLSDSTLVTMSSDRQIGLHNLTVK
eukprot:TRINITY_DN181_c0_g1_i1.p1 TRINITY_DN181_c0_g1~~TRINITY_DN181_c0_g1_i1.p1  ORF type:complete len:494 (-),score=71.00 TRINITY_DN181_c0_g1_i1:60-1541(-)